MSHKFRSQQSKRNNLRTYQNLQSSRNLNKTQSSINSLRLNKVKRIKKNPSLIHQIMKLRTSNHNLLQTNKLKTKRKKIHLQANRNKSLNLPKHPIKNLYLLNQLFKKNIKLKMMKVDLLKVTTMTRRKFLKLQWTH
jgi:hypothetical protein